MEFGQIHGSVPGIIENMKCDGIWADPWMNEWTNKWMILNDQMDG